MQKIWKGNLSNDVSYNTLSLFQNTLYGPPTPKEPFWRFLEWKITIEQVVAEWIRRLSLILGSLRGLCPPNSAIILIRLLICRLALYLLISSSQRPWTHEIGPSEVNDGQPHSFLNSYQYLTKTYSYKWMACSRKGMSIKLRKVAKYTWRAGGLRRYPVYQHTSKRCPVILTGSNIP